MLLNSTAIAAPAAMHRWHIYTRSCMQVYASVYIPEYIQFHMGLVKEQQSTAHMLRAIGAPILPN